MAITQKKEFDFKLKNIFSSGDYIKNEIQTIHNKTRTSMESKLAGQGDGYFQDIKEELNADIPDDESAYEESFCSEHSDEDSESKTSNTTRRSSIAEIPLHQFSKSNSSIKKPKTITLNKKFVSTSKICDTLFKLEDRIKCLSLNEIRPIKNVSMRTTRKNMSFTNDQTLKIERDNEILLRKIMAQQRSPKKKLQPIQSKPSSSAINRKKLQRKIEEDNMVSKTTDWN